MEFAWNTQKNKMNDIKGKEMEQDRKGKISNEEIDLDKTYKNYDLVQSDLNLYQRIIKRIDDVRENSRIQKNSVVCYSNVITVNKETFNQWGEQKSKDYLQEVYNYFCNEFGKENVVSAKVHLDETTPHMHLHFVPVSSEGKLQARKVVTPSRINKVHSEAVKWLQNRNFDVIRGKGSTGSKNIKDIHKYKTEKLKEEVELLEQKRESLKLNIEKILIENKFEVPEEKELLENVSFKAKDSLFSKDKLVISKSDFEDIINLNKNLINENLVLKKEKVNLEVENNNLKFELEQKNRKEDALLKDKKYLINKQEKLNNREKLINEKELAIQQEFKKKDLKIKIREDENLYYREKLAFKNKYIEYLKRSSKTDGLILDEYIENFGKGILEKFKWDFDLDKMYLLVVSSDNELFEKGKLYKLDGVSEVINKISKSNETNLKTNFLRYEIYTDDSLDYKIHIGETNFDNKDFKKHLFEEKLNLNEFLHKNIFIKSFRDIEKKNKKQINKNCQRIIIKKQSDLSL